MPSSHHQQLAQILWDYNYVPNTPQKADLLLVMGMSDLGIPRHAAMLAQQFSYKYIVVTGGVSHTNSIDNQLFNGTEAEMFKQVMVSLGIPASSILLENTAQNTGQNITESHKLLAEQGAAISSGVLVHTPTMMRRALATAQKQWPSVNWIASCAPTTYQNYTQNINKTDFINSLVGDTFRILDYPSKGFQTPQPMPEHVKSALFQLIESGYTKLISAEQYQQLKNNTFQI